MSYAAYPRRHGYQRSQVYGDPTYGDMQQPYQQDYDQDYEQDYPQHAYPQQPHSYTYGGHDRHHHSGHHRYSTVDPHYLSTSGRSRHYYPSSRHSYSRRHTPIIVGSTHDLGRYTTTSYSPTSSSKYRAEGNRGQHIPVVSGSSYRPWTPFTTQVLRLFGLGPKRHSGHRGVTVHLKRSNHGRRERVYTI